MNALKNCKIPALFFMMVCSVLSCDKWPDVESLPQKDVAFKYAVIDDQYQIDYYIGATIQFTSTSVEQGECQWDFGDGSNDVGEVVTHKYENSGHYDVKLTISGKSLVQRIYISDIFPILKIQEMDDEVCEVLNTYIKLYVEVPNPEGLPVYYKWTFPEGTLDEAGNSILSYEGEDPGKIKFRHVGSQRIRLNVTLGDRMLEEKGLNIQVGYFEEVSTLYYAVKGGNIHALKLARNAPPGMNVNPYDMGVNSGQHALNVLYSDTTLYILDCGMQFTYVAEPDNLGDGRITSMSKDGTLVSTIASNAGGNAYDDPYFGYISGSTLYVTDRNVGISTIDLTARDQKISRESYFVQNATLGYYGRGYVYGSMNANIGKINNVWYWCKTYNGQGIFRFKDSDILPSAIESGAGTPPADGIALNGMFPKSFVWDEVNQVIYFTIYDDGHAGLYRCTLDQLNAVSARADLAPYACKLANGKSVVPITEAGKGEGSSGEFIGVCQLTLDKSDGSVYFGLRSGDVDVKSGLMRYNPETEVVEYVIEGVEVYGVAVNNTASKLF